MHAHRVRAVNQLLLVIVTLLPVSCGVGPATSDAASTTSDGSQSAETPSAGRTSSRGLDIPSLEPISGYGDFSEVPYHEIDWTEVTSLLIDCANDNGILARVLPPGDGYTLADVPLDQQRHAVAVMQACRAGLNLPDSEPLVGEMLEELYQQLLETMTCLEDMGYDVAPPQSLDSFVESYPRGESWHPYPSIPDVTPPEWERINQACPQP